ncbi:hypothetical protein HPB49_014263 [Dermacentor silvarum]|uniref:Uncharacterized protein n=1 Tax=Dermacentor silvarum TaxID=543639 RepID=A0ACB8CFH0_DERSI|nr:hypothetical protein HPB49_014263 [Dermacentor silvarum]
MVAGDFNAPHTTWGYAISSARGTCVLDTFDDAQFTLLNNVSVPTRRRDHPRAPPHSPDLSWWLGRTTVSWSCEPDCWGSDHHPIHLGLPSGGTGRLRRLCRVVDWDRYRAVSESTVSSFMQDPSHCLSAALVQATRTSWVDESRTTPDLQLLRLWASRRQAELASERDPYQIPSVARRHEHRLERGRWIDWCSSLGPSSSNASIWRTFRVMERGRRPPEPAACALLASGQTPAVFAETVAHTFFPALDTAPPPFVVQNSLPTDAGTPPTLADIEARFLARRTLKFPDFVAPMIIKTIRLSQLGLADGPADLSSRRNNRPARGSRRESDQQIRTRQWLATALARLDYRLLSGPPNLECRSTLSSNERSVEETTHCSTFE